MPVVCWLACLCLQSNDLPELLRRLGNDDPAVRDKASAAIHRLGARVIPDLERALATPDPEIRGRVVELLQRIPEYALRPVLDNPRFPSVRKRWNAVMDAVVGKRPIPKELWQEVDGKLREARVQRELLPKHTLDELLTDLDEGSEQILLTLVWKVGVQGMDPKGYGGGLERSTRSRDYLSPILAAEPDAETFDELYGTLLSLQDQSLLPEWDQWSAEDTRLAIRILVFLRRRPDAPVFSPPTSAEDAVKFACRGPMLRGMADALGRAFANRDRRERDWQKQLVKVEANEQDPFGELRKVYRILIRLDRDIGDRFFAPDLLLPARARIPDRSAPIPDLHRGLFDRVRSAPVDDGALRVIRDVLANTEGLIFSEDSLDPAAALLRALGDQVAQASRRR